LREEGARKGARNPRIHLEVEAEHKSSSKEDKSDIKE